MKSNHTTPAGGNIFADLNLPNAENLKLRSDDRYRPMDARLRQRLQNI